jgi:hypothetical protein
MQLANLFSKKGENLSVSKSLSRRLPVSEKLLWPNPSMAYQSPESHLVERRVPRHRRRIHLWMRCHSQVIGAQALGHIPQ